MARFKLEFLTDNKRDKEIAQAYWKEGDNGKFFYRVDDLKEKFRLRQTDLIQVVKGACRVTDTSRLCRECGGFIDNEIKVRSDINSPGIDLCPKCMEKWHKERERKREQERKCEEKEQAEREKQRLANLILKQTKMEEAYKNGVYEQLSPVEFNFLVALAELGSLDQARERIGLKKSTAEKLFYKFDNLHLFKHDAEQNKYEFLPKFAEALIRLGQKKKVKLIFGSPKEKELYLKLKDKYLFVYPQQPLSTFIDMETVQHLFTKPWHRNYFLTCRIDCLVCQQDGSPSFVAEYQGGGHDSDDCKERDQFKKKVLEVVGMNLLDVNNIELSQL